MKRNQIKQLHVHLVPAQDERTMAERANQYHIEIIERRLEESGFTQQQKAEVLKKLKASIAFKT